MIFDKIENLYLYNNIPCLDKILEFIKNNDLLALKNSEYIVKENEVTLKIAEYYTRPAEELFFETHDNNIDLQIILNGVELMQITDLSALERADGPPELTGDFKFYVSKGKISNMIVKEGFFSVFFHDDAHRPSASCFDSPMKVKKAVFKIRRNKNK